MNTKQLFQALLNECITRPYFDGVYAKDLLKDIEVPPKLIVCNTDPSSKPGTHWVLFFFDYDKNEVDFFDSLGKDITSYGSAFKEFANKFADSVLSISEQIQPVNSSVCGQYCLYYAFWRCKGYPMHRIVDSMASASKVNHFVNTVFSCDDFFKCCQLQTCVACT